MCIQCMHIFLRSNVSNCTLTNLLYVCVRILRSNVSICILTFMCSCLYFKIKRVNLYNNVYVFVYVQYFKIKRVDLYTNILCSCMYSILKIKCVICTLTFYVRFNLYSALFLCCCFFIVIILIFRFSLWCTDWDAEHIFEPNLSCVFVLQITSGPRGKDLSIVKVLLHLLPTAVYATDSSKAVAMV